MDLYKKSGISILLAAAVLLAVIFAPSMSADVNNKIKPEKALEYISQKHGVPEERLMTINEKEAIIAVWTQAGEE